ncbi:MAG: CBS domain-containing protein [Sphingomonadaceae bacterium]
MTIRAILTTKGSDILSISGNAMVSDAVALLAEKRIGALPVVDDGAVCGIFSERDVIYGLAREGAAILSRKIAEVMISPAITVTSDDGVIDALGLMTRRRIRHLPVIDEGTLSGFVSIGDLVKHRIDQIEADAAAMRDYIQGA